MKEETEVMEEETVDDAVAYSYYPQKGRRSWGGDARRGMRSEAKGMDRLQYAAWWNDYVILGIQVESVEAVTNVQKLAKPGVSVVTFGPNDLSFNTRLLINSLTDVMTLRKPTSIIP